MVKRKLYERLTIPEYGIVDPIVETVTVYRHTQQGYTRAAMLSGEHKEALTTSLLPDLAISLSPLFHE